MTATVSRSYEQGLAQTYVSKSSMAATTQVTGRWSGRQLGLRSFLASAAVNNGVKFDGLIVAHKARE